MIFPPQIKSSVVFRWFKTGEDNIVCEVYDRDQADHWLFSYSSHISELSELISLSEPTDTHWTARSYEGQTWADYLAYEATGELPEMNTRDE